MAKEDKKAQQAIEAQNEKKPASSAEHPNI
ncbi:hypothetical protein FHT28_001862 [Rhizobium sp. SG570]|jgi:hypothetical protein|nr:hypothetical protein [Rhizobium sp. SG741]NKJ35135.1 hypothetical protein [Rhizobium sp. SG570]